MESSRIPFSTRAKNLTGALNLNSLSVTNGITGTTITASGEMNANSLSVTNGIAAKDITTTGLIQGYNLHASAGITGTTITATDITASDLLIINGMVDLNGTIDLNGTTGNSGDVLTSNGTSDPTWSALAPAQPTITSVGTLTSLTVNDSITQNFDIITSATWSDYHLIPMFEAGPVSNYVYSGVAKKMSFTQDNHSRFALRFKQKDSAYGNFGTLYTNTFAAWTFAQLSDNRLKHNEKKIKNGLDVIRRIEPQEYQKTGEMLAPDYNGDISGEWQYEAGFIAQEIKQIPEISYSVLGGDTIKESGEIVPEPYSVNYNNIFTYAVAGLKELDAIVTTQATLIEKLEARLVALENK